MVVGKYWAWLVCLVLIASTEVEANCDHVSYEGREWVPERLQASMSRLSEAYCQKGGDQRIIVTSGVRKPAKQAQLMLNCLRSRSCGYYANQDAAKEIQQAYDAAPQQQKISAAAAKIAEQVSRETPCYISKHLTSYALDLERRNNGTSANCQRDLGPVNTIKTIAVETKIIPIKARGVPLGHSQSATSNAEWGDFGCNPKGRGHFAPLLCYQSLI